MQHEELNILYEDNHLLVVVKPAGMLIQGDKTGDPSLLDMAREWLIGKYDKPGSAFLGLVHRLDRPAAGVVVFAKTSKAANRLSIQFRERTVQKEYLAVVEGTIAPTSGELVHYIRKRGVNRRVQIAETPLEGFSKAELNYAVLAEVADKTLVQVQIHTGRHHQIRAQLAAIGHPIVGDRKYRASSMLPAKHLALFAAKLSFTHPVSHAKLTFQARPAEEWPWTLFSQSCENSKRGGVLSSG